MNGIECNNWGGFKFGPMAIGHCGGAVSTAGVSETKDSLVSFSSAAFEGVVMVLFEESWSTARDWSRGKRQT
jgi:hypothetical protein